MSGSDIAPFVAAVLRDEVVDEMKNEIDELQSRLFLVQITGIDGTPVHYKGSMRNGGRRRDDQWCVRLEENDAVSSLTLLNYFEIWLCGTLVHTHCRNSLLVIEPMRNFKENDNESSNLGMGSIEVTSSSVSGVHCMYGTIGPMLRTDYEELPGRMNLTQLMDLRQNGTALGINVEYIMFDRKKIPGILALLEQLGTDTMEPLVGGPPSPAVAAQNFLLNWEQREPLPFGQNPNVLPILGQREPPAVVVQNRVDVDPHVLPNRGQREPPAVERYCYVIMCYFPILFLVIYSVLSFLL